MLFLCVAVYGDWGIKDSQNDFSRIQKKVIQIKVNLEDICFKID